MGLAPESNATLLATMAISGKLDSGTKLYTSYKILQALLVDNFLYMPPMGGCG